MNPLLLFAIVVLASYRLTRLVVADVILDGPRQRLVRHGGFVGEIVSCSTCAGVWVSALVVAVTWAAVGLPAPSLWFAAVPGGQMLLSLTDERLGAKS